MDSNNDASKDDNNFTWTDVVMITLCAFLNMYLEKNGRNAPFKWTELQSQFEMIIKHKFQSDKALKNKYNGMRTNYNLWKSLKHSETGLGWDESSGKIVGSSEWWKNKIKENQHYKRFSKKQPSVELQEAWSQLFGDVVANGENCVAPSIDPSATNQVPYTNLEDNDEITDGVHNNYASRLVYKI